MADSVEIDNAELLTPRDFRREFAGRMEELTSGKVEKLVFIQRNQMTAVVIPFERFAQFERMQEALDHIANGEVPNVTFAGPGDLISEFARDALKD